MNVIVRILFFLISFFLVLPSAAADELRPGYLEVIETPSLTYAVKWKMPIRAGRPLAVEPRFPADCIARNQSSRIADRNALISSWVLTCQTPLQGRQIDFAGLDATTTDLLVRFQPHSGSPQALRATPDTPIVSVAEEATRWAIAHTYFFLGIEHILFGFDHLLFVLALVLLITGLRRLIETITAFTLAHSVTLIATSLNWVSLPIAPIEAVIALSIVFLASELALVQPSAPRFSERNPWLVALIFGLLHGFGFAGALAKLGLPSGEVPMALLTFNLGIEAGQLAFVTAVLAVLAILMRWNLRDRSIHIASYAIGITACVWLIDRIV